MAEPTHTFPADRSPAMPMQLGRRCATTLLVAALSAAYSPAVSQQVLRYESLPTGIIIQSEGSGYILAQPRSSMVTRSGGLIVIEGTEAAILQFDSAGRFTGRYGRQGGGPGEFRQPASLTIRGDSIVVWDPSLARLSIMTSEGRVVRSVPVRAGGQGMLLPDGRVATMTDVEYGGAGELARQWMRVIVRDSGGGAVDTILARPRPYRSLQVRMGNGMSVGAQPFDDGPLFAVARDQSRILQVTRAVSRTATFTLTMWDHRGRMVFTRSYAYQPIPLRPAQVNARVTALTRSLGQEVEREIRRALFIPQHLPTVTQVFFWPDGGIVLRREAESEDRSRYTVLDPEGRQRFEMTVPSQVIPVSGNGSRIAFFIRDAPGGPYYRLVDVGR